MNDLMIGTNSAMEVSATWVSLSSGDEDGSIADTFIPLEGGSPEMNFGQ